MKVRFVFLGLVILCIAMMVNSCQDDDRIILNKTSLFLENEDAVTLIATSSYSNKKVIWKSSNFNVVTVTSNGLVTAISKGEATIIASVQNRKQTATCSVTVADYREKWVGNWDFIVKEDRLEDGIVKYDSTYYSGTISLGSVSYELDINYKESTSMTVKVSKGGAIFFYDYAGSFHGNNEMHISVIGKSHFNPWSLEIDGIKKEENKNELITRNKTTRYTY